MVAASKQAEIDIVFIQTQPLEWLHLPRIWYDMVKQCQTCVPIYKPLRLSFESDRDGSKTRHPDALDWRCVSMSLPCVCVCVSWPIRVYRFMMSAPRAHYRFDMDKAHYDMVKYCHFNHQSEVACAASCLDFTKILIALSSDPRRNRIERRPLGTWSFQSKVLFPLLVRGVENCLWGWCDVTCFKRSCLWPKVKWGFENWSEA